MRVLAVGNVYLPHQLAGGIEVVWQGFVRYLRERGVEVRVLTTVSDPSADEPSVEDDADIHRELRWYWQAHEWPPMSPLSRLRLERHNARVFNRHLDGFAPDVITWWGLGGMSLSLVERGRRAGIPGVLFVHDYWPSYGPERDLWTRMWSARPRRAALAERLTGVPTRLDLGGAGRWLFNSSAVEEETLRTGLEVPDRSVLSPGVDELYLDCARESGAREWSWRLLYAGRVVEQKGVRTAVESLALLPSEAHLTIVGDGDAPYHRELEELAQALGVAARTRFEPPRPHAELIDAYRDADAVLFPVQWPEPFGLVPLEAMAMGRPVIATGMGGSGEYLADEVNSLLFAAGDAQALAAAISRVASDAALRERLVEAGYDTAARHSARTFNERALAEIQALIAPTAPPPRP